MKETTLIMYRGGPIILSWCVGLVLWTGGAAVSDAQEALAPDVPIQAAPAELKTRIMQTTTPQDLPPGSYPADQLVNLLPPHAPQLLPTEATNGLVPTPDIIDSRIV